MEWLWAVIALTVWLCFGVTGVIVWVRNAEQMTQAQSLKYPDVDIESIREINNPYRDVWSLIFVTIAGVAGLAGVMISARSAVDIVGEHYWVEANGSSRGW